MGLSLFKRCSSTNMGSAPVPTRFKIVRLALVGECLVAELQYPDCTNFEGRKIMVFSDAQKSLYHIKTKKECDPHFADNDTAPVARFKPTSEGWDAACQFALSLSMKRTT